MRPHPSTCATIPQWPGCRSALRSNLSSTSGGHRRGSLGQACDAYTIHVSSLPQTGVSLFDCRYPCEKERLPLTRRFFCAPVPMAVGGGAWLLLRYMRYVFVKRGMAGFFLNLFEDAP